MNLSSLIQQDCTQLRPESLHRLKRQWSQKLGYIPKNSAILAAYRSLLAMRKISPSQTLETALQTRKVRSISGVTPFAVMTKPFLCPGQCTFCPLEINMPKSYLSDEPAGQRAQAVDFDPYLQVVSRIEQLEKTGHTTEKIELIVIGGTFSAYPKDYKQQFFKAMFDAVNGRKSRTLTQAQKINETAPRRIVGISIETRPDWIDATEIRLLRQLGVTKLQIGVQALDGHILKRIKRGHSIRPIAHATRLLRDAGFKICYHYMPNLPGSNPKKDIAMAKKMYTDRRFKPDFVKIYPTQIIPQTALYREWQQGKFKTHDDATLIKILKQIKLLTPRWCRIDRLVRDISKGWVADGTIMTNMRQVIQQQLKKEGKHCACIRCREVKHQPYQTNIKFRQQTIDTVGAAEIFLTYETPSKKDSPYKDCPLLYALLRLRLPNKGHRPLFPELRNAAIIREVHTYGRVNPLSTRQQKTSQHRGLGKKLIAKAEQITKTKGYPKIAVIAAIGTREYYRKLGYKLDGLYMIKNFW